MNSTLYCDKNCSFIDDLPVTCDVVDSKSGQLLRETKSPKELYYLRGIYNSGTSQNVRYFFVSRQKADDGMISVRADGTD